MEMLLMGACMSLLGLAVTCLAFNTSLPPEERIPAAVPETVKVAAEAPGRFFGEPALAPLVARTQVPIEALLLQIENHVRLEHAAAESFLAAPDAMLLRARTMSPLVN
jgi:hypothetical protein